MKNDLSDVTVILDRSGSMGSCKEEAENGINHFIEEQKKHDGECVFSLVQFDTEYEFVHKGIPIKDVPEFKLVPRGMTALLDAVGRAINETGERLDKIDKEDRPGLVVFVILTDGDENASSEFTRAQIKEMIERQQNEYNWQFTFLGANQDAFAEARSIGIGVRATANYSAKNTGYAFTAASANLNRMRSSAVVDEIVDCSYLDSERESMED